tara:strand:- start:1877 stop:2002 length:126 start_codon:yes stop_codon:yes gene_type:complete
MSAVTVWAVSSSRRSVPVADRGRGGALTADGALRHDRFDAQ